MLLVALLAVLSAGWRWFARLSQPLEENTTWSTASVKQASGALLEQTSLPALAKPILVRLKTESAQANQESASEQEVRWLKTSAGNDSWYSEKEYFDIPQTNRICFENKAVTLISRQIINTNAVLDHLQSIVELDRQIALKLSSLRSACSNFGTNMTKDTIVQALGILPAKAQKTSRWNYAAFSPHPENRLPDEAWTTWPLVFVYFDENDKFVRWNVTALKSSW